MSYKILYIENGERREKVFDFTPIRTGGNKDLKPEDRGQVCKFIKKIDYIWSGFALDWK